MSQCRKHWPFQKEVGEEQMAAGSTLGVDLAGRRGQLSTEDEAVQAVGAKALHAVGRGLSPWGGWNMGGTRANLGGGSDLEDVAGEQ